MLKRLGKKNSVKISLKKANTIRATDVSLKFGKFDASQNDVNTEDNCQI